MKKRKRRTHEEFVHEMAELNASIEVVGHFTGTNSKVSCKCKTCGHLFDSYAGNMLHGTGCPECGRIKRGRSKTANNADAYYHLASKRNDKVIVIGEYSGYKNKILCRCKKCSADFYALASDIVHGSGHYECYGTIQKTTEQFRNEIAELHPNIEIAGKYINDRTKIECLCRIDGHQWRATPNNLLRGKGCPRCGGRMKSNQDEFLKKLSMITDSIEILGEYNTAITPIESRCKKCGYIWEPTANSLLSGHGCPHCVSSEGEAKIDRYLSNMGIRFTRQMRFDDCRDSYTLPFDFFLPDHNICIEYHGVQHYYAVAFFGGEERFRYVQRHDRIKKEYCLSNNLRYIEIPYTEFENIDRILAYEIELKEVA